jgi:hypothetical protein
MKILIILGATALVACGCRSPSLSQGNPALRSEREYTEKSEARAQNLYRTGQASRISEARARAVGETNTEWAAAAKATERKQTQGRLETDLSKMNRDGK